MAKINNLNKLLRLSETLRRLIKKRWIILGFLFFLWLMILAIYLQLWNVSINTDNLRIWKKDISSYKSVSRDEFKDQVFNSNYLLISDHIAPILFWEDAKIKVEMIDFLSIWEEKQVTDGSYIREYDGWLLYDWESIIEKRTRLEGFFNADKFNDFMAYVLQKAWYIAEIWEENNYRFIFDDIWEKDAQFATLYSEIMSDINKMYMGYIVETEWVKYLFIIMKSPGELIDQNLSKAKFMDKINYMIDQFYQKLIDTYKSKSNEIAQLASTEWKWYKYMLKHQSKVIKAIEKLRIDAFNKDRSIIIVNLVWKEVVKHDLKYIKKYLYSIAFVNDAFYYYLVN